jgi:hypothetical protein
MEISNSQLRRIKKRVLRLYPKSRLYMTDGKYYVWDGNGNKLHNEYMIPPQKSSGLAWYWFDSIIKINQNIQRTHPNKMSLESFNKKFNRISNRNKTK